MEGATFKADYFYMIMTYGHDQSDSPEFTAKLAGERGVQVDYIGTVKLVDNYLPVFDMDEELAIEKHAEDQVAAEVRAVSGKTRKIPEATDEGRRLHQMVADMGKQNPAFNNGEQITVTEGCVGCGICTKVCPIGNFTIKNGRAVRRSSTCEFCLSCAHNCPQKAIVMSIMDRNPKARYRNKFITLEEIIAANHQNQQEQL
jgi:ferredoxin